MTIGLDSQNLESYVPVYDVVPEKWEDARPFIVEQLKKVSIGLNSREIGFFLDQELLTGKAFIPGINEVLDAGSSQQFRSILRFVMLLPNGLTPGMNLIAHDITNDANFTLFDLWCSATDSTNLESTIFCNYDTIRILGTNVEVTSDKTYDRAQIIIEYLQEL